MVAFQKRHISVYFNSSVENREALINLFTSEFWQVPLLPTCLSLSQVLVFLDEGKICVSSVRYVWEHLYTLTPVFSGLEQPGIPM